MVDFIAHTCEKTEAQLGYHLAHPKSEFNQHLSDTLSAKYVN